jgi:hypothetical protein
MPDVAVDAQSTILELGDLWIHPPVRLQVRAQLGEQLSSRELLAGAYVRAYALLDADGALTSDPEAARAAVPIAETRLDTDARATVLLPATLNEAPLR